MGRLQELKGALIATYTLFAQAALEADFGEIYVHRTRPISQPQAPSIYHVLGDSPTEEFDWGSSRTTYTVVPRLVVPITGDYEIRLDDLGDLLEDILDRELRGELFRDLTERADRITRRERIIPFGEIQYLAHEFPVRARMRIRELGPQLPRP